MLKVIKTTTVLMLIILIAGCIKDNSGFQDYDVALSIRNSKGVRLKYYVKNNESLKAALIVENNRKKKYQFIAIPLFDYRQTYIFWRGKKSNHYLFEVPPKDKVTLKFKTLPLKEGIHDFTFVVFRDPYNYSVNANFRDLTEYVAYRPQRTNLIVGNKKLRKESAGSLKGELRSGEKNLSKVFIKTTKSTELKGWYQKKVRPGSTIKYYVHIGNSSDFSRKVALLVFLDYKQISLRPGLPLVLVGEIGPRKRLIIPAYLNAPQKKGRYELLAVVSYEPFQEHPNDMENLTNDNLESSIRTLIEIR